ncbi:DUF3426 domain-containing protein [Candidatus Albibeggiatoa sp. nov. NOAA]|uniref:DUF3426 domain-containing protein n=1 Tax=Candidatus Albibeggiatoa sp. nov. NOAA TaxID=3162724 RepID=UPI0032F11CE4|nr:DUF3426 domain-containing protein [Thiotrichaceae bacterium]
METQCPHCQTIFRINLAQLKAAEGIVLCSQCDNTFDAQEHILEEKPQKPESIEDMSDEELAAVIEEEEKHGSISWLALLFWLTVSTALVAGLAGQYMWWQNRDFVLQHEQIRPLLVKYCEIAICDLPDTQNINKFRILEHTAIVKSEQDDVIQFNATFENQASFPQPFPNLLMTFQDEEGQLTGQRIFKPAEYLKREAISEPMKPNATAHLQLDVVDVHDLIENQQVMVESYKFDFVL